MKIVYLAEWYPYMSAKVTHSIATRLVKMGCQVVVLASTINLSGRPGSLPNEEMIDGVKVKRIGASLLTTSATPYVVYNPLAMMDRASEVIEEVQNADIVHAQTIHGLLNMAISAILQARGQSSKLVVSAHGVPHYNSPATLLGFGMWTFLMKRIATKSRLVITVAKSSIPTLLSLGIRLDRIRHIPNGVDSSLFRPSTSNRKSLRQTLGIDEADIVVMSLGQIRAAKGILTLLSAIPEIIHNCGQTKILIAGSGPLAPTVQQWLKKQDESTKARIILVPRNITEPELPSFFSASDIFVLPSYWEGLPLTLLEAMACGACPVATRVGDIPHVIEEGLNGLLFQPGDPKALAALVNRLAADDQLRLSIAGRSVETTKGYDWDSIAKQCYLAYSEPLV